MPSVNTKTQPPSVSVAHSLNFLVGGDMAGLIKKFDWSTTGLGLISSWPAHVRTAVNIMLQSPVPIVMLWGKDGIMLYNDAYAKFAGGRHPKLLGSKVTEGWPEVADFNRNVMANGLRGKTLSYKNQQLTLHRNGQPEEVWMDLNYSPMMDEDGKPAGVMAIVVETTRRVLAEQKQRQAEVALRNEQKRLQDLFMHAPAMIAVLRGPEHIFHLANPIYMQVVGQRDIIGKPIRQALPELKGQGLYELLDEAYRTGQPMHGDEVPVMLDRSGRGNAEQAYFNFVYQPYCDDAGQIEGIMVHAVDLTQQVQAHQKVQASEERFRFMAETLPLKIFTASPEGDVIYFNPQWAEYTGVNVEDLLENRVLRFMHPDDVEPNMQNWRQALQDGKPLQSEQRLRRHDGQYRRHISYARPMHNEQGDIVSWFGSMTDIEDTLQASLDKEILELKTASLQEQRRQLLAISKAKDEFVALSSHQLRTPATAVKQYISMVLDGYFGPLAPDQQQSLRTAYESNELQLNIINDLLKTAQLDSDSYSLKKERLPIADIVDEAADELRSALDIKHQKLVFAGRSVTAKPLVDRGEMKLVVVNLIENAIKYSHPGSTIWVTVRWVGHDVEIEVRDEGVGMSSADARKIFQKFTRINNELSDTVDGSGLGLYWVKRIIKLHRGSIKVRSTLGQGSTFCIRLPG